MKAAAFLRGVNVGGVTMFSRDLTEVFSRLGYTSVTTVLASGNVCFEAQRDPPQAKAEIEAALRERFAYVAWVQVLELDALAKVIAAYPFAVGRAGWHDYVILVGREQTAQDLLAAAAGFDASRNQVAAGNGVVYWTVEKGRTLDSDIGKTLAAARFKPWVTTRTLATLKTCAAKLEPAQP